MRNIQAVDDGADSTAPKSQSISVTVLILASLIAFAPLSIDMYLPSFPQIAETFGVPPARVELSLATFFVGLAIGQLFYGTATDKFGRKPPLYIGLTIYFIASIGCASAPNVEMLIGLRFFQAFGACAGIVIARAMVRDLFSPQESARIFSLLMLVMGIAPILAPLFGGYVAFFLGWRAIFVVVAAVSVLCLIAVVKFLPETRQPNPSTRIGDALKIYWNIAKDREFLGFTLAGGLAQAGMFAYITGSPFVFINLFGISAENYGWVFGSNALGLIAVSQVNDRLLRRYEATRILRWCLTLTAIFSLILIAAGLLNFGFWGVWIPLFLFMASLGMVYPNTTAGALAGQSATAGAASALIGTMQYGLAAISAALVSHFNDGTTLPMTFLVGVCGISAFFILHLMIGRNRVSQIRAAN